MEYYALQVKTRGEERFIALFEANYPETELKLSFPKRVVLERRAGKEPLRRERPVFPGYLFAAIEETEKRRFYFDALRRTPNFYRFLPSNSNIIPLAGRNLEIALHFIRINGAVAGISKVYFNEDDRISVVEGPLRGLEGSIIKVDRRKSRAKIKLDLYGESFSLDLAFEIIARL
jgi:transcriptional antiterminator NusG